VFVPMEARDQDVPRAGEPCRQVVQSVFEPLTMVVSQFPQHGVLYASTNGTRGARVEAAFSPGAHRIHMVDQYAVDVVEVSSYYVSGVSWHPGQALGAPDVSGWGDSRQAWCARTTAHVREDPA
jgi:hypothetical protein